jgi:hypothetical protein
MILLRIKLLRFDNILGKKSVNILTAGHINGTSTDSSFSNIIKVRKYVCLIRK